jgi:hypothetical protein
MNERIKQLAKEAGFPIRDGELFTTSHEECPITSDLEEFAELIIADCYSVIIKSQRGHFNPATSWDAILKHFGDEE